MDIPSFERRHITQRIPTGRTVPLPAAPFSLILLLKLQAWSQHRAALEYYFSKEQHKDRLDLECLVPVAASRGVKPKSDTFLPASFLSKAETRVQEYLTAYPQSDTRGSWVRMGFNAPSNPRGATTSYGIASTSTATTVGELTSLLEAIGMSKTSHRLPQRDPLYSYGGSRY